ncbi:MAG: 1,4-alpha-glucan branching protein domain-containing protein [Granulicella sp.]
MTQPSRQPSGFLSLTLHAHLPYVINHGTWPHGMEWLHEATAETYLPLLRVLGNLERDGIGLHCNLNLSPILLEQLAHPVFIAEFPKYLARKIVAAREDEAFFTQSGENHYAETARAWHRFFTQALDDFNALNGDLIHRFRHFHEAGLIDIITSAATHGYLPLLGTDESVRAQIRTAVQTHHRHLGTHPRGIWSPECGYRPAGPWTYPVADEGTTEPHPGFNRIGLEQAFSESGLEFFYVDTHLIEGAQRNPSPYELLSGAVPADEQAQRLADAPHRSLYQPYYVDGTYGSEANRQFPVSVFPRDPRSGFQVWSGDTGYPGDYNYLDFHKKRWPGGHRYWRVTGDSVDMNDKQPYYEQAAADRVRSHAAHFVALVTDTLASGLNDAVPPILCAPFDAELFGHWWFEGPQWLEAVARELHDHPSGIALISSVDYLDKYPRGGFISMPEGSWGAAGKNQVWMNPDTSWTYTHIYPAERFVRELASGDLWRSSPLATQILQQICRELLLLESSDWQFLITTGAARDYAEVRFLTHNDQFNELKAIWETLISTGSINEEQDKRLAEIQTRDSIFLDIDPNFWATGAHNNPAETTR